MEQHTTGDCSFDTLMITVKLVVFREDISRSLFSPRGNVVQGSIVRPKRGHGYWVKYGHRYLFTNYGGIMTVCEHRILFDTWVLEQYLPYSTYAARSWMHHHWNVNHPDFGLQHAEEGNSSVTNHDSFSRVRSYFCLRISCSCKQALLMVYLQWYTITRTAYSSALVSTLRSCAGFPVSDC